jgi:SAM-dependent methyltransferase
MERMASNRDVQAGGRAGDWPAYFDAVKGLPPRETLVAALDAFERDDVAAGKPVWRIALDIGCGEGRDTREILRRAGPTRWRVMACDSSGEGLERLSSSLSATDLDRINLALCAMEDLPAMYPRDNRQGHSDPIVDLVNGSFALPHCPPERFPAMWAWIAARIHAGGRFAGQFFGVRDEWAKKPDGVTRTYHTRDQVEAMLAPFTIEMLDEVEKPGKNAFGEPKYWHVFHVVARKR